MKDLTDVVLDALDLHASYDLPSLDFRQSEQRIVVASGNALPTARMMFEDGQTVFFR